MLKGYSSNLVCCCYKIRGLVKDRKKGWWKLKQAKIWTLYSCNMNQDIHFTKFVQLLNFVKCWSNCLQAPAEIIVDTTMRIIFFTLECSLQIHRRHYSTDLQAWLEATVPLNVLIFWTIWRQVFFHLHLTFDWWHIKKTAHVRWQPFSMFFQWWRVTHYMCSLDGKHQVTHSEALVNTSSAYSRAVTLTY